MNENTDVKLQEVTLRSLSRFTEGDGKALAIFSRLFKLQNLGCSK